MTTQTVNATKNATLEAQQKRIRELEDQLAAARARSAISVHVDEPGIKYLAEKQTSLRTQKTDVSKGFSNAEGINFERRIQSHNLALERIMAEQELALYFRSNSNVLEQFDTLMEQCLKQADTMKGDQLRIYCENAYLNFLELNPEYAKLDIQLRNSVSNYERFLDDRRNIRIQSIGKPRGRPRK